MEIVQHDNAPPIEINVPSDDVIDSGVSSKQRPQPAH